MAFAYQTHVEKRKVTNFLEPNATHIYWQDRVNTEMRLQQRFNANVGFEFKTRNGSIGGLGMKHLRYRRRGRTSKQREALFDNDLGKVLASSPLALPEPGRALERSQAAERRRSLSSARNIKDRSKDLPIYNTSQTPTRYIDSFARRAEPKPQSELSRDMQAALDEIRTGTHKAYSRKRLEAKRVIDSFSPNSMRHDLILPSYKPLYSPLT